MHWNYMDLAMVIAFGCCAIGYSELIGRYSIVLAIGNSASASVGGIFYSPVFETFLCGVEIAVGLVLCP